MVCLPDFPEVSDFLQQQEHPTEEAEAAVALFGVDVEAETARGRALGRQVPCLLADVLWPLSHLFVRANALRSSSIELLKFMVDDVVCRPRRDDLLAAVESWIHDNMDEDTAADYVTGEEEPEMIPEEVDGATAEEDVLVLQRRVAELEARLALSPAATVRGRGHYPATPPRPQIPRGVLFGPNAPTPTTAAQSLEHLKQLAGSAPMRLGAHEKAVREGRSAQFLETAQQEASLEATGATELDEAMPELEEALTDPLQKLMYLQMRQLSILTKQQQEKRTDPLHAALGGGEASGGSSGVKGCLARDAFVRMASEVGKLAPVVQANAAQELGLDPHQVGSGLMREYLEKRCPLGEQRLLTQMGYILAAAWEHGFKTQNQDLMGHAARAMVFIDQTAMDAGRTNLSWLLTGLPEPQYSIVQRNKIRTALAPFSRLAPAA